KPKLDGNFYEANNNLWFKFDDEYNDQVQGLTYRVISTTTNAPVALIASANNQALSSLGDNRFRLDLFVSNSPIPTGYYILEVTDEKGAKFYLRFRKN
ncbi:MAG: hypothetical protein ACRCYO_06680, partial [Bacteroidia bacterium]